MHGDDVVIGCARQYNYLNEQPWNRHSGSFTVVSFWVSGPDYDDAALQSGILF